MVNKRLLVWGCHHHSEARQVAHGPRRSPQAAPDEDHSRANRADPRD